MYFILHAACGACYVTFETKTYFLYIADLKFNLQLGSCFGNCICLIFVKRNFLKLYEFFCTSGYLIFRQILNSFCCSIYIIHFIFLFGWKIKNLEIMLRIEKNQAKLKRFLYFIIKELKPIEHYFNAYSFSSSVHKEHILWTEKAQMIWSEVHVTFKNWN